jgi:hypothetical protein
LKGECRHQKKTCPREFHRNLRPVAMAKAGRFHDTAIAPNAGEDFAELRRTEAAGRPLGLPTLLAVWRRCWDAGSNAAPWGAKLQMNLICGIN